MLLYSYDVFLLQFINSLYHNYFFNSLALVISYFGLIYTGILIAIILYIFGGEKGKKVAILLTVTVVITFLLTQLIKLIVMRPRPYTQLTTLIVCAVESDYSFPSGHTSIAAAISYVLGKEYNCFKFTIIIPILVGLSRMYFGVHYPSDVICGFLLGILIAFLCEYITNQEKFKKFLNIEKLKVYH